MAASMGYNHLASLAHAVEHVLAGLRDGTVAPTHDLVDLGFDAVGLLERGVALAGEGRDDALEIGDLVDRLSSVARPGTDTWPILTQSDPTPGSVGRAEEGRRVTVRLRPGTAMPLARATLVLKSARELGAVAGITPPDEAWGTGFGGTFSLRLLSPRPDEEVRHTLEKAGDGAVVGIGGSEDQAAGPALGHAVPVERSRLDLLLGVAGELVTARNQVAALAETHRDPALEEASHRLGRLVSDLRAQVLQVRMAPVDEIFGRFPRMVRDLARQLGRRVILEVSGGEIELDRSVLDRLGDPLLHLLRNAVDHGIEPPEVREAAGKPPHGTIRLTARRDRNTVVVEVSDDGRGVDREAVLRRAAQAGWAGEGENLDDDALLRLLARPGLSTAPEVTGVSGRGVGIDAVVHQVRSVGGATGLVSQPGMGTTVTLRLPLTVAIVPALLVGVAAERYAVPLGFIAETTRLPTKDAESSADYHGRRIPVVSLNGAEDRAPVGPWRPGVVLDVGGRLGILAVDTLLGQEEIVVGPVYAPRGVPLWVNGATILADGRPALILDPTALV
jgi:two-component system chemotaxis sensor kinase CheA